MVIPMKRTSELLFWHQNPEWYTKINGVIVLTDKAPERARKSFEAWKKENNM